MKDPIAVILQMLLNYNNQDLINDEWTFLSALTDEELRRVVSILNVLKSGCDEHIDYRSDMQNHLDDVDSDIDLRFDLEYYTGPQPKES